MTKRELRRLVTKWQKILGFKEWTVELETRRVKKADIPKPRAIASAAITPERKIVRIAVYLPHVDRAGKKEDEENSIVHELVHIFFDPVYPNRGDDAPINKAKLILLEQSVDSITNALIYLDRKGNDKSSD